MASHRASPAPLPPLAQEGWDLYATAITSASACCSKVWLTLACYRLCGWILLDLCLGPEPSDVHAITEASCNERDVHLRKAGGRMFQAVRWSGACVSKAAAMCAVVCELPRKNNGAGQNCVKIA